MVQPIKGRLARAVRERKVDTAYLDELRNRKLSFNNMKDILELIDEAGDKDSLFYDDIVSNKRNPEEVIETLQALYDEKSGEGFGSYYSLPYGGGQTIGDKTTGNPVNWVNDNAQELYDEILNGNPIAFLSGMAILVSRARIGSSERKNVRDAVKLFLSKIQTDNERWQSVNKEQLEGAIEGNEITQGYDIVKRLNALHVEDKEYATVDLSTWMRSSNYDEASFINIMKIYEHMLKRTTMNFSGPLVDFYEGGNTEIKNSLLGKLLRAQGPTALETLFSNYLTFRFSRGGRTGSAVGGGDLIGRKNVTDWVLEMQRTLDSFEINSKYPALANKGNESFNEKLERIRLEVRVQGSPTQIQFEEWKNDIVPQIEDDIEDIDDDLKELLKKNDYFYMLSVYHLELLENNKEEEFNIIPDTYSFSALTQEGKSSFFIKAEQFKNAIALASTFNTQGKENIQSVLDELRTYEKDEDGDFRDAEDYWEEVEGKIEELESSIKTGIDKLFTPIPNLIIAEMSKVLSTLNPNKIESLRNFIKIENKNPYEYLHDIDALYDANLEKDPDYYKR